MDRKLLLGLIVTLILVVVLGFYIYQENTTKAPSQNSQSSSSSQTDSSTQQAIATPATYKGTLPCADCSGIDTTLVLNSDNSYEMTEIYQGKNDDNPFVSKGTWAVLTGTPTNPEASVVVLTNENGETSNYLLEGNKLTQLDSDKNPIDASYNLSLTKVEN